MDNEKKEIRFYDGFEWVGVISDATSVQFKKDLYGGGGFEIHYVPKGNENDLLSCGRFFVINGDVEKCGFIDRIVYKSKGSETEIVISGISPTRYFLSKRVIMPESIDKVSGELILHYIKQNLTESANPNRRISNFVIPESSDLGGLMSVKTNYENLYEEVRRIAKEQDIGVDTLPDFDAGTWRFALYKGADKTLSQNILSPVVFSSEYKNLKEYQYTDEKSGYRNTVYAFGSGTLNYEHGSDNQGLDRIETRYSVIGATTEAVLKTKTMDKMVDYDGAKELSAVVHANRVFKYQKDYSLGDMVSVYIKPLGIYTDSRVTETFETWEDGRKYSLEINIGKKPASLFERLIKQNIE